MPDESFLPIGRIRKAHGVKGEVSVDYDADSLDLLQGGVYLRQAEQGMVLCQVASFRVHHASLLVLFEGIDDRNAAETLRNCEILVPADRLPKLDGGGMYLHELPGLRVIAITTPDAGAPGSENAVAHDWGIITAVADNAGQELWTISRPGEADVLFPAAPELVLEFDRDARLVRIAPPPGLLDLYRS